uniref:Retrotransposon gag domain-containing protein n=1 Tax=Brassica oleracea var. oleracea TaxID=109376 RepID=A0A0D3D4A3_BRAOL
MDHLERFEDLISTIRVKGVSEDYLLCKIFRYSLGREALHWLKQLQPESLKSWSEIKNAFLCNFFDEARAEDLRSKIATFTQEPAESF